jgi:uncharacterized SAM-binding protein YcdF (DUF218 family)
MDSFFFWFSKLVWLIVSPDTLLLIWFGVGFLLLWLGKVVWARRLLGLLLLVMLVIGLFPVGEWLLYPLENRYPANPELDHVDGVIVLSGAEDALSTALWDQVVLGSAAERDLVFMALARAYPAAKLVFTGGAGSMINQDYKAADVARRLFSEQGLDMSRIVFERESRNTIENAALSKALVAPEPGEKWVLITTAWHMSRSVGVFCKLGWNVVPYPVDFQTNPGHLLRIDWGFADHLENLVTAVKEWLGLAAYWMAGKVRFEAPGSSCSNIS